jgi:GAF domain-containing protein
MTPNVVAHVAMMANQAAVHVQHAQKAHQLQQLLHQARLQLLNVFVLKSRMPLLTVLFRLRKQENNHAATSTQKIS